MTNEDYRAALARLGLSRVGAAPVLGISRRQAQRYAAQDAIPEPVARLVALYLEHGIPKRYRSS